MQLRTSKQENDGYDEIEMTEFLSGSMSYKFDVPDFQLNYEVPKIDLSKFELSPIELNFKDYSSIQITALDFKKYEYDYDVITEVQRKYNEKYAKQMASSFINLPEISALNLGIKQSIFSRDLYQEDLKAVRKFLYHSLSVNKMLEKLESILQSRAGERFDAERKMLKDYQPGQALKHHKLLSGYLKEWGKENGFNFAKVDDFLTPYAFNRLLATNTLFKDVEFRNETHGEWTHFIQWWCLVEANKESHFLSCEPAELLRRIGSADNRKIMALAKESTINKDLPEVVIEKLKKLDWYMHFEIDEANRYKSSAKLDSVFKFNLNMIDESGQKKFPVLSQLLLGRMNKRKDGKEEAAMDTEENRRRLR